MPGANDRANAWPPSVNTAPADALRYLIAAREHVASQKVPPGYRQMPHSDDTCPVGGDPARPAMLDASYRHFGRSLISLSYPESTESHAPYKVENGRIEFLRGFSNIALAGNLETILHCMGIGTDDVKFGHDRTSRTHYVEIDLKDPADYERARAFVTELVHGHAARDAGLMDFFRPPAPAAPFPAVRPSRPTTRVDTATANAAAPVAGTPVAGPPRTRER